MLKNRLNEAQWNKLVERLPKYVQARAISNSSDYRRFVDAVLWLSVLDLPWSDLPADYGSWRSVYVRFIRWCQNDVWRDVIQSLHSEEYLARALSERVCRYEEGLCRSRRYKFARLRLSRAAKTSSINRGGED